MIHLVGSGTMSVSARPEDASHGIEPIRRMIYVRRDSSRQISHRHYSRGRAQEPPHSIRGAGVNVEVIVGQGRLAVQIDADAPDESVALEDRFLWLDAHAKPWLWPLELAELGEDQSVA